MVYLGLHSVQFREISIFDELPALGGIYSQALLITKKTVATLAVF